MVVDTTVQEKAIAYPTDGKLYDAMRRNLVRMVQDTGIASRQSYVRCGRHMLTAMGGAFHPGLVSLAAKLGTVS